MENKRYLSQIRVAEIGEDGQRNLKKAKILIVGCGALGSPVSMYLAGAGVGYISIADFDTVDLSNLHRQVFYNENELGELKADCMKSKISALNEEIVVDSVTELISKKWLNSLNLRYDLIIDAADNPSTTYLLNDYCSENNIPLVTAGVSGWSAQIFTFIPGSATYSDIFPKPELDSAVLPCSLTGIVGPVAGLAATLQASQALKILCAAGRVKSSSLIIINLLDNSFEVIDC